MVSFLNLPAYITEWEILEKLQGWGVAPVSDIRRRMWPGTHVADGTRFLRVKFTDRVQSLPYSARFLTALGPEFFRVVHDRQARVCRLCLQPGHILKACPEFWCFRCREQGHYARECGQRPESRRVEGRAGPKCNICANTLPECVCNASDSGSEMVENRDAGRLCGGRWFGSLGLALGGRGSCDLCFQGCSGAPPHA